MNQAPPLLMYCQHSLGMGHLVRSFNLARALARRFRVVFLNGGPIPEGVALPLEVEFIHLPPLGQEAGPGLVSRDGTLSVAEAKTRRRALLLEALAEVAPQVLLIELFPFGRKKFADELLPLLRRARRLPVPPLVLCSLRDLLVDSRRDQQHYDDRARWLADRYFDGLLVHADPDFATLDDSFRPRRPLSIPVCYTGFIAPATAQRAEPRERRLVVSAGGGRVGGPLLRAALEIQRRLWIEDRIPMTLVAGPFLPEEEWRRLQRAAGGRLGLDLVRSVPALAPLLSRASLSLSQCGYNTAMDVLAAGSRALFVPYCEGQEVEQLRRAQRLAALGLGRLLHPDELRPDRLLGEIRELDRSRAPSVALKMDGAERSVRMVQAALRELRPQLAAPAAEAQAPERPR